MSFLADGVLRNEIKVPWYTIPWYNSSIDYCVCLLYLEDV